MNTSYTSPGFDVPAFNCPNCGAFAKQTWTLAIRWPAAYGREVSINVAPNNYINNFKVAQCDNCGMHSFWLKQKMVYPYTGTAPLANPDMPEDVRQDYDEARSIVEISPRGAAALLRLAIQRLCKHLGQPGDNINTDIGNLVKNGLPTKLQQALDSVRVIGNNAVHPGQIDLTDDIDTARKLFVFVNIITDNQISQPKLIGDFYTEKVPDNLKEAINKRDGK
jgi:hypothetical protein